LEPPCVNSTDDREHIRAIALQAFDEALKEHTKGLFDIWLKDVSEQPKRAQAGWRNSLSAYNRAQRDALKWDPQLCEGKQ